jgi:DNA invertase Pin-like site-specific DNA recombinase
MSKPRRLGISYSRFSDPKQQRGDSQERQDELFRGFCERHNLTPLGEVFADKGRSGYKDEHRQKGRLGQLIAAAKDRRFEPGSVIVVEAWDRLGRLRPDKQTELVAELLRTGVSIGVCRLDDIFSEDDFGTHKWTTLAVFIQLAFQESKQKAERVADSWRRRRDRAREDGQLLTGQLPAWVERTKAGLRLIPDRGDTVRRIFRLAADGLGEMRIVKTLTRDGTPPFGEVIIREGRSRSQFAGRWCRPYVALILRDRRVLGEMQPRTSDGEPAGPALAGYFPPAVTEEEFLLAQAGLDARRNKDRGRAAREARYVNAFRGLLRHARDGEGFMLHNKGTAKEPSLILVNASGVEGRGRSWTFPYPIFEEAILGRLRELDPREILPREKETPLRVDVLRARLARARADLADLQADLKKGYSRALAEVLREKEAEEEQVGRELQEELARSVKPAARAWEELPGLVEMIRTADDPDAVRLRLRVALRQLVEHASVLLVRKGAWQLCCVQLGFTGGARRDYLIGYIPAAYCRKGGWWCRSFAAAGVADSLDLRKPAHAARLEKALLAIDLDELQ